MFEGRQGALIITVQKRRRPANLHGHDQGHRRVQALQGLRRPSGGRTIGPKKGEHADRPPIFRRFGPLHHEIQQFPGLRRVVGHLPGAPVGRRPEDVRRQGSQLLDPEGMEHELP